MESIQKVIEHQRVEAEQASYKYLISSLLHQGFHLSISDGEEYVIRKSNDRDSIMDVSFSTDEQFIVVYRNGIDFGNIEVIYGNGPVSLISDHSVSLDDYLKDFNTYTDKLMDLGWST